jgi:DNA-binding transcriptional regulator YdaS (Cro superfamily)
MLIAATIEKESHGLVTRKDLFPDTWQLIWPELQTINL